eukprot:7345899-Pyramimonas_sp.AAC.1
MEEEQEEEAKEEEAEEEEEVWGEEGRRARPGGEGRKGRGPRPPAHGPNEAVFDRLLRRRGALARPRD